MLNNRFLKFTVFSLVGLAVFLAGFTLTRESVKNQQALIDNSLVDRFDKQTEKRAVPTGVFQISSDKALFPTLMNGGKEIWYYNPENGEIRSASTQNLTGGTTLVARIKPGTHYISWGQNATLIAQYASNAIFYDLNSNYSKNYSQLIKVPVLNRNGDKTAYNYFNTESGEGNISIADTRIENFKNILSTRFESWQIEWLDTNTLFLTKPPTLNNPAVSAFILNDSGSLQPLFDSRRNFSAVWSQAGSKVLYSHIDISTDLNGLFFMNRPDKQEVSLGLTWDASRCVWSIDNKTAVCATKDGFMKLDTSNGKPAPEKIASDDQTAKAALTATGLLLTSVEDYLVFKNSKDGKLYGLKIK